MVEDMIRLSLTRLKAYIESEQWKGYDPYDALNSPLLKPCSFGRVSIRTLYTQILKKIPVNTRKILMINKGRNPKAMGLFLASYLVMYRTTEHLEYLNKVRFFMDWLLDNSSDGYAGYCWGYNFPWQSGAFFLPAGEPTVVNTCFAANAFLDVYDLLGEQQCLKIARSSCDFIIKSLNIYETTDGKICFSYTPFDNTKIHNANLLAAALLSRVYSITNEVELLNYASRAVDFCISYQNKDGSWYYGLGKGENRVDNFHTGFVLESLYDYSKFSQRPDIMERVSFGLRYYKSNLFAENGLPRYYDRRAYPIDIHSAAEGIILFSRLRVLEPDNLVMAKKIALWTIRNMQDSGGYFYYQKNRLYMNKIPYMRWAQAWMFKALVYLAEAMGILRLC